MGSCTVLQVYTVVSDYRRFDLAHQMLTTMRERVEDMDFLRTIVHGEDYLWYCVAALLCHEIDNVLIAEDNQPSVEVRMLCHAYGIGVKS